MVDFTKVEVVRGRVQIALAMKEFRTLEFMIKNARRVISRDELLNEVWGYENYPCTRTVDNHILKLRKKLENDPANPAHLVTIHGMGYKFMPKVRATRLYQADRTGLMFRSGAAVQYIYIKEGQCTTP
jgi:DNA-binding response OmpR family regulator